MTGARERAEAAYRSAFRQEPERLVSAPGRVNLIGEHTDYNDGFVLPCAIDRRTWVAIGKGEDSVEAVAADLGASDAFRPDAPIARTGGWADYVRGVAVELIAAGTTVLAARLAIASDVPAGAGLSSSAALELAVAYALASDALDPVAAALLCQRAENRFVGCHCGIMDQLVSATARADHALMIDCRSLATRPVPLPPGLALLVIDSGVRHAHAAGDYNSRRNECERAARHYGVAALRDLDEVGLEAGRAGLDDVAYRRARHVVTENARVLAAADALSNDDLEVMSMLMAASHRSMRDDFEISVPPLDELVELAGSVLGKAGGARMTGGGFGGCVVVLAPQDASTEVAEAVAREWRGPGGKPAGIHLLHAAAGVAPV